MTRKFEKIGKTIRMTTTEEYPVENLNNTRNAFIQNIEIIKSDLTEAKKGVKAIELAIRSGNYLIEIKNKIKSIKLHIKHQTGELAKKEADLIELEKGMSDLNVPFDNKADKKVDENAGK